jgi:hypothetical protein
MTQSHVTLHPYFSPSSYTKLVWDQKYWHSILLNFILTHSSTIVLRVSLRDSPKIRLNFIRLLFFPFSVYQDHNVFLGHCLFHLHHWTKYQSVFYTRSSSSSRARLLYNVHKSTHEYQIHGKILLNNGWGPRIMYEYLV